MLTGILLIGLEELLDLLTDLSIWELDIVLDAAVVRHEGQKAVISDIELVLVLVWTQCAVFRFHSPAGIPCG